MKRIAVTVLICLFILCGCAKEQTLELYIVPVDRVSESGMTEAQIGKIALEEGRLALRGEDLAGVDWQRQRFAVRPEASQSVSVVTAESGGCSLLKTTDKDLFVWMLNGKAVYAGGFERGSASVTPQRDPCIVDSERYIFEITSLVVPDRRYDKRLYDYFHSHDLIKSELS